MWGLAKESITQGAGGGTPFLLALIKTTHQTIVNVDPDKRKGLLFEEGDGKGPLTRDDEKKLGHNNWAPNKSSIWTLSVLQQYLG